MKKANEDEQYGHGSVNLFINCSARFNGFICTVFGEKSNDCSPKKRGAGSRVQKLHVELAYGKILQAIEILWIKKVVKKMNNKLWLITTNDKRKFDEWAKKQKKALNEVELEHFNMGYAGIAKGNYLARASFVLLLGDLFS